MEDQCRLCLKQNRNMENIFSMSLHYSDLDVIDIIYWVFGIEVEISDHFTKLICRTCINLLEFIGKYRQKFQKNQKILQNYNSTINQSQKLDDKDNKTTIISIDDDPVLDEPEISINDDEKPIVFAEDLQQYIQRIQGQEKKIFEPPKNIPQKTKPNKNNFRKARTETDTGSQTVEIIPVLNQSEIQLSPVRVVVKRIENIKELNIKPRKLSNSDTSKKQINKTSTVRNRSLSPPKLTPQVNIEHLPSKDKPSINKPSTITKPPIPSLKLTIKTKIQNSQTGKKLNKPSTVTKPSLPQSNHTIRTLTKNSSKKTIKSVEKESIKSSILIDKELILRIKKLGDKVEGYTRINKNTYYQNKRTRNIKRVQNFYNEDEQTIIPKVIRPRKRKSQEPVIELNETKSASTIVPSEPEVPNEPVKKKTHKQELLKRYYLEMNTSAIRDLIHGSNDKTLVQSQSNVNEDLYSVKEQSVFVCNFCNKLFSQSNALETHIRVRHEKKKKTHNRENSIDELPETLPVNSATDKKMAKKIIGYSFDEDCVVSIVTNKDDKKVPEHAYAYNSQDVSITFESRKDEPKRLVVNKDLKLSDFELFERNINNFFD